MKELLYIGAGGFLGTLTRYAIQLAIPTVHGGFPWAVFLWWYHSYTRQNKASVSFFLIKYC